MSVPKRENNWTRVPDPYRASFENFNHSNCTPPYDLSRSSSNMSKRNSSVNFKHRVQQLINRVMNLDTTRYYSLVYRELKQMIGPHIEIAENQYFVLRSKDQIGRCALLDGKFLIKCCQAIKRRAYKKNPTLQFLRRLDQELGPNVLFHRWEYVEYMVQRFKHEHRGGQNGSLSPNTRVSGTKTSLCYSVRQQPVEIQLVQYQKDQQDSRTTHFVSDQGIQLESLIQQYLGKLEIYELEEIHSMIPMEFVYEPDAYLMVWVNLKDNPENYNYALLPLSRKVDPEKLLKLSASYHPIRALVRNRLNLTIEEIMNLFKRASD